MYTEHEALIKADVRVIYDLVAAVDRWPERLPHYRWVRFLAQNGNHRLVEMAARHHGLPLSWRCEQELFPEVPRINFSHVDGITAGMTAEWTFMPGTDVVRVKVTHDLRLKWPLIGKHVADLIIGPLFVAPISAKTLHRIKVLAES